VPSQKPPPCPLRSQFGKNVLRLRRARKLTQEALAETVGLSTRYTQSIEAGEYFPALPTLAKLREALDASWDELFLDCNTVA
jgi:transcriptional regulator with XRE-family HTH domain